MAPPSTFKFPWLQVHDFAQYLYIPAPHIVEGDGAMRPMAVADAGRLAALHELFNARCASA